MRLAAAIITAVAVLVIAIGGSYALTLHALDASQRKWCATLNLLTSQAVPKPADPASNPSRQQAYVLYSDFLDLRHRFGCG
jgi:hypothetical protein